MTPSFIPKNAFPLPAPITPKLVALGLDDKIAATVSKVYLSVAHRLKETCETEYTRACDALITTIDDRGYSSKELRSELLTVMIARYTQALSKWVEAVQKAEASLPRKKKKPSPQVKVKNITFRGSSPKGGFKPSLKQESAPTTKPCPFHITNPSHAFPHAYPPPVGPEPITFVTHIPSPKGGSRRKPETKPDYDLDGCIAALARLSLGPSSPNWVSSKPSETTRNPRSRTHVTSKSKPRPQLFPSLPRLVSPVLDTSVALSDGPLPKNTSLYSPLASTSRTQNVDIPRSNRRKACSTPYRRPMVQPSTSPESPSFYFSHSIRRTPSLVSDHGSDASSPSTPPDFSPIPIPPSTLPHKDLFPEVISPLEAFLVPHSGWEEIDFGTDLYG